MGAQKVVMRAHAMTMKDGYSRASAGPECLAPPTHILAGAGDICSVRIVLDSSQFCHGPLLSSSSSSATVQAHDCVSHVATLTNLTKVRQLISGAIQCTAPRLKRGLNDSASRTCLVAVGNRIAASRAYKTAIAAERGHEQTWRYKHTLCGPS